MNGPRLLVFLPLGAALGLLHCVGDTPIAIVGPDSGSPSDSGGGDTNPTGDAADAALPSGTVEWVQVFTTDETGDLVSDAAHVAIAADGTILVEGHFAGPTQFGTLALVPTGSGANVFATKLDRTGKVVWAKDFGNLGAILPAAIAANDGSDAYVGLQTGGGTVTVDGISAQDNTAGGFGCSMFKLGAADGKAQWAYAFGASASTSTVFMDGIAVHGTTVGVATRFNGKVQIVGPSSTVLTSTSVGQDGLVTLHDDAQSGKIPHYGVMGGAGADEVTSIAADSSGAFYIAGSFASGISPLGLTIANGGTQNTFVAKVDSNVAKVWAQNLTGAAPTTNTGNPLAIATDGAGNVYLAGGLWGYTTFGAPIPSTASAGGEDGFLAQVLATDGTVKYARAIGGTSDDEAQAIAAGPGGYVAVAGNYTSSGVTIGSTALPAPQPARPAAFVARAAGAGTYTWAKGAAAPNSADFVKAGGVAIDPNDGSVVVAGTFSGQIDLGDGKMRPSSSAGAHQAFYVMKIAP